MAKRKGGKKTGGAKVKANVKKRTLNDVGEQPRSGAPFNEQDVKRRLGNYGGAGEHPRQGGRTTGIVGQTKQAWSTNRKLPKKAKRG